MVFQKAGLQPVIYESHVIVVGPTLDSSVLLKIFAFNPAGFNKHTQSMINMHYKEMERGRRVRV